MRKDIEADNIYLCSECGAQPWSVTDFSIRNSTIKTMTNAEAPFVENERLTGLKLKTTYAFCCYTHFSTVLYIILSTRTFKYDRT
jgi:hypothetical protein